MKTISKIVVKVVFLSLLLVCTASLSMATIYYVSSTGNDANSGLTTALPWKTLAKVNATSFKASDKILFKSGDTWYGTIIPKYSATTNAITYGKYGTGANPIITGFTTLTGWINEGNGIYSKVITAKSQTNMVLIDGKQYAMGRTPNKGSWLTYESFSTNVSITDNQLTGIPNWTGAEACIYKNGWEINRCKITNHVITTITYTDLSASNNTPILAHSEGKYFFQNSLQTLDAFGEWYHDYSGTGKFYMYFGAVNPNTKTVKVATLENLLFNADGRDNVSVRDISFYGCIKDAISLNWQNDNTNILACSISYTGLSAMLLNGVNDKADSCVISNVNSIGIYTNGINAILTNNNISKIGLQEAQGSIDVYRGAMFLYGDNPTIQFNTIDSTAYTGIGIGTSVTNASIKNNYFSNTCVLRWDLGTIYTATSAISIIIEGNTIIGTGGAGIYLDQGSGGIIIRNNTISDCDRVGIKLHATKNNIITGNTVYNCIKGIDISSWTNIYYNRNNTLTNNVVVAKTSTQLVFAYTTRYPDVTAEMASHTFNYNVYARPIDDNLTMKTNILPEYEKSKTLSQWQTLSGQDANSKKSPQAITSENDLRFEYNATKTAKTITLSQPMIDVKGTKYATSLILQPYTSVVLMKDAKPTKYSIEYKSICDGLSYNGWTTTGKYERTLLAKSGADSIVTTYLTVNPKYAIQENITILSGETYQGWSTSGTYTRTLSSVSGCDSVITTHLTVDISAVKVVTTQTIQLKKGNNMISTYLQATNPDVSAVTQPIRDSGNLIKMQNESGSSYENWGILGGWINNLGSLQNTEGYKIMVANDCALQITGNQIALPLNISLNVGWNIISFPRADILDAQMIIQSLIDQSTLVKVQDEIGNSIEDWGIYGGWKNGIGNFLPGKAYRVKVNKSATLTIQDIYPKSVAIPFYTELPEHFQSVTEGNGSDHMNINLVGLNQSGLSAGDELAAFDGNLCVGTLKITEQHLIDGTASLVASCSTNNLQKDGFDEGSSIQVRIWNHVSGIESGIQLSFLQGSKTYSKSATMLGKMPNLTTSISNFEDEAQIEVYPNPSQGKFTVRFSEIPESGSRIDILDLSGRKVASQLINGISEEFDLLGQAAGMYLVKSIIGSVEKINKLVIQ
jgi:parallel beta-helix repeat protein